MLREDLTKYLHDFTEKRWRHSGARDSQSATYRQGQVVILRETVVEDSFFRNFEPIVIVWFHWVREYVESGASAESKRLESLVSDLPN